VAKKFFSEKSIDYKNEEPNFIL